MASARKKRLPLGTSNLPRSGGAREDRTPDLLRARQALSQLSYGPQIRPQCAVLLLRNPSRVNVDCPLHACLVGLGGVEPPTSPLSGVRSNQLSYRPSSGSVLDQVICVGTPPTPERLSLKEVIQPQVPLGLPCYDFTPVMNHTVVIAFPKVRLTTSGATHSHGVTGGVYKARERIHRGILIRDY